MSFCPQCGAQNPNTATFCNTCGQSLAGFQPPAVPAVNAKEPVRKQTLLGLRSPVAVPAAAEPNEKPPAPLRKQTLLGIPASLVATPEAKAEPSPGPRKQTLLGIPAPLPTPAKPPAAATAPLRAGGPPQKQTLWGVAVPGVAPTSEPLIGETSAVAPVASGQSNEEDVSKYAPVTPARERRIRLVPAPALPFWKRPTTWALGAAGLSAVAGSLVAWWLPNAAPLHADVRVNQEGREVLHIRCASCPDGTQLTATGAASGAITKNNEGEVLLGSPLRVGTNRVVLAVDRPGNGRDETVGLDVPLAYRIAPDLSSLQGSQPTLGVVVEAVVGATVVLQGQAVPLDGTGHGRRDLDVTSDVVGPAADARTLERVITYAVTPPGGKEESGSLTVRTGIVPLVIEVPGARIVTDAATFPLAGKTSKDGAIVTVGGQPLALKPDGTFVQLLGISSTGRRDIEIRAAAPPLVPRTVRIDVTRVMNLAEEGRQRQTAGNVTYDEVRNNPAAALGKVVAWKAEVVETNVQGPRTIAVVDVRTGCQTSPCLARVAIPGAPLLARATVVTLYGAVTAMVTVKGTSVPDIALDFYLPGP